MNAGARTVAAGLLATLALAGPLAGSSMSGTAHAAGAAAPATAIPGTQDALEAERWRLVLHGEDHPDDALDLLATLPMADATASRQHWVARGLVLASAGRGAEALAAAEPLQALDRLRQEPDARAGAALVRAAVQHQAGHSERAATAAAEALAAYGQACEGRPAACLAAERWHAHMLAHLAESARGTLDQALAQAQAAQDAAAAGGDSVRRLRAALGIAATLARKGEHAAASATVRATRRQADRLGHEALAARVALYEAVVARLAGDTERALPLLREGVARADAAGLRRQASLLRINLVDLELRAGHPAQALAAAEQALPVVRESGSRARERVLLHNMGLARLALGEVPAGRRDLDAALALWSSTGAERERAAAMREYADALAEAGELHAALAMLKLARHAQAESVARVRESSLADLNQQFQRDEQEREIALRRQQNALRDLQLDNQRLRLGVGAMIVVVIALAAVLAWAMLRRLKRTQHALERQRELLRDQSERDALTGLANRRHFLSRLQALSPAGGDGLRGGLALIDIDHFKQINDQHGHGGGDEVLREVARRLADTVRGEDLLARWGGEEFLVYLPQADEQGVRALAVRALHAVAARPVQLASGRPCRVTVSVGHARFPLPSRHLALNWEPALNLVDMAQYLAKAEGRNQACGIVAVDADTPPALEAIAADFELAVRQGHVLLAHDPGPAALASVAAATTTG